jgi:F0F1-type ATP synthase assembly protein I
LGLELAATVLATLGAGYWMDRKFATRPVFFLIGGAVGVAVGLYHFLRTVTRL